MNTELDISLFLSLGIRGLFFVLLLFFTFHAIFLAYHWFAYGNNKSTSILALGIYLSGGAILLITFAIALNTL